MTTTRKLTHAQENAKTIAKVMIGNKALCHLRGGKRKVMFFVTDTAFGKEIVSNVSAQVALITNCRRDKEGWVIAPNTGYDPALYLVELYDEIMDRGKTKHFGL